MLSFKRSHSTGYGRKPSYTNWEDIKTWGQHIQEHAAKQQSQKQEKTNEKVTNGSDAPPKEKTNFMRSQSEMPPDTKSHDKKQVADTEISPSSNKQQISHEKHDSQKSPSSSSKESKEESSDTKVISNGDNNDSNSKMQVEKIETEHGECADATEETSSSQNSETDGETGDTDETATPSSKRQKLANDNENAKAKPEKKFDDKKLCELVNSKIALWQGDMCRLKVGAIVNAANESLWAGGGICGAIHRAAGYKLARECREIGYCPTGQTVTTNSYDLPCDYVLHTVGPVGRREKQLESCYRTSLDECIKNNIRTISFCCVSTGIFGFPQEPAAHVALRSVRQWLVQHAKRVGEVKKEKENSEESSENSEISPTGSKENQNGVATTEEDAPMSSGSPPKEGESRDGAEEPKSSEVANSPKADEINTPNVVSKTNTSQRDAQTNPPEEEHKASSPSTQLSDSMRDLKSPSQDLDNPAVQDPDELVIPGIDKIIFCCFLDSDKRIYQSLIPKYFPQNVNSNL